MIPTVGRIVLYTLTADEAEAINARRKKAREHINQLTQEPTGAMFNYGQYSVSEGDVYPAMIVAAWGKTEISAVNLQVLLDGNDQWWKTSICVGEGPGTWAWPHREAAPAPVPLAAVESLVDAVGAIIKRLEVLEKALNTPAQVPERQRDKAEDEDKPKARNVDKKD